jgi:hypothetical protein
MLGIWGNGELVIWGAIAWYSIPPPGQRNLCQAMAPQITISPNPHRININHDKDNESSQAFYHR